MKPVENWLSCGYAEGYYGKLPDWKDRHRLLQRLAALGMNRYLYAPKADPLHRRQWRTPYEDSWRQAFSDFCSYGSSMADSGSLIRIEAGIAPGLDFDFTNWPASDDLTPLVAKAQQLKSDGAHSITLLMDDIEDRAKLTGHADEGEAHAGLANALSDALGEAVQLVPRVYADSLAGDTPDYLPQLIASLDPAIPLVYCGDAVISRQPELEGTIPVQLGISPEQLICWDNLYANDYCPRRLWLGPWEGRQGISHIRLNPTGMVETDLLLLAMMRRGRDRKTWRQVLAEHEVPEAFLTIARWCDLPPTIPYTTPAASEAMPMPETRDQALINAELEALQELCWNWQGPLQREWYPVLFGLLQEYLFVTGRMSPTRPEKLVGGPLNMIMENYR